jgi:phosphonate transport system permease protein
MDGFTSFPKAFAWLAENFVPTAESFEKLPTILDKLVETVLMAIGAATLGGLFAFFFAISGSQTTRVNAFMANISRWIATLFRNIDISVWSMILLFSFGQNVLTGYFALFFGSFGYLTRSFMETIDEVSGSSVEALRATGASYMSIIFQSVIPASMPQMLSWVMFIAEMNIRNATLVGILTGTGIGFTFNVYYKSMNYNAAGLVVLTIVCVILLMEWTSNYVRREMM